MALFGFNKAKVLSVAERCVQQGKLQNAIVEYEKIAQQDPKDLTVLNTIGDLYARLGHPERAASYFRKVGDAYAADGFTVKAIAMYKKLTKLSPTAIDSVLKLAELYTQQGLYNDARAQYVQVADQHVKTGDLEQAARIFQKMLELDPENTAMQSKLAELYVRLRKTSEARDIYFRAAESLYSRGALDAADDALGRVLGLDPGNGRALMLRGRIALDSGKAAKAVEYLEKTPQIDSLPDALSALLRAYLAAGKLEEAGPIAHKLLTVHNDLNGLTAYVEALTASGDYEKVLRLYSENAERLFAANAAAVSQSLRAITGRVKENPAALELLRDLYQKAGDTTQIGEVTELLAHALVQSGELERARDLYQHLTELEPENTIHAQNYRQIVARLGEDTLTRPLTHDEGEQPFLADEIEFTAPVLSQDYPPDVADALRAATTESELYASYNIPAKAITPLEAVLHRAPNDAQLNQRLASLYARANRFDAAARCCTLLERLYQAAGYAEEAAQYGAIAAKYAQSTGMPEAAPPLPVKGPPLSSAAAGATPAEFTVVPPGIPESSTEPPASAVRPAPAAAHVPSMQSAPAVALAPAVAHELDLSDEWENALLVEPPAPAASAGSGLRLEPELPVEPATPQVTPPARPRIADLIAEAEFYLSQAMYNEAAEAIARCETATPGSSEVAELKEQLAAARRPKAAKKPSFEVIEEPPEAPAGKPTVSTLVFDAAALGIPPATPRPAPAAPQAAATVPTPLPQVAEIVAPAAVAHPAGPPSTPPAEVLRQFTAELDAALGPDFALAPEPSPKPAVAAAATPPAIVAAAPAISTASLAAAAPAPSIGQRNAATAAAAAPSVPCPGAADALTASALSQIFAEFKEDVEEGSGKHEDTETHYNLGVAFKEMGLLDEAIGELQKVCHAIDRGESFPRVMQAYTWLAQCFMEKGVPEAGVRWYEKALHLPGDEETSTALHYELACAHEAAGNRPAALSHFMEVYGTNIDYRDVAERIKGLKS